LRSCGGAGDVTDVKGEHLAVADLELLHGFGVVVQELPIVVEVLGGLGDLGFGLYGFFEGSDGGVGGEFEGDEVGIVVSGSGDG
jgi:hypothetical protein